MFSKLSKNSSIKNIAVVTLSNIGDVVLTAPVIDILLCDFPEAVITVIVGPKAQSLFADHPRIRVVVYDKHISGLGGLRWFLDLRKTSFDVTIDLRQTALSLFLMSPWHTPIIPTSFVGHMRNKHLNRLKTIYKDFDLSPELKSIVPLRLQSIEGRKDYVVIVPGAADGAKRWEPNGFIDVTDDLIAQGYEVVFVGDKKDQTVVESIQSKLKKPALSLAGQLNLRELAFVLKQAKFAITHDSGVMHLASYFNIPVVVLWGPTDISKYGPWSKKYQIVMNREGCPRCAQPKSDEYHTCMNGITVKAVLNAIKHIQ